MVPAIATISRLLRLQVPESSLAGWKDISPKDGGFRVRMPDTPAEKARTVETIQGPARITPLGIERDGVGYRVIRTELPSAVVVGGPKKSHDEARDKGVGKSGGTLAEEKEIELDGHPGGRWSWIWQTPGFAVVGSTGPGSIGSTGRTIG